MSKKVFCMIQQPEYIFEASWEVCNRVGGIYAVLSTRAASMVKQYGDSKVFFFGPDLWRGGHESPYFNESKLLLKGWREQASREGLQVRIGHWNVPGKPIAILLSFGQYFAKKNEIFGHVWDKFRVNSLEGYGDYDESCIFGYATGIVMRSLYNYLQLHDKAVCAHFNEWMTAFGLFYVKEHLPQVGTLFTTHATSIGRSIAGNQKPLYDYINYYDGDQMARELNMVAKHSVEKQAAHHADCFTTVSDITNIECTQLLEKAADVVTPNGFENDFVPQGMAMKKSRKAARELLKRVAEKILGFSIPGDTLFIGTGGRYEYKNKGLDVFMQALRRALDRSEELGRDVLAFIMVPAWISGPRQDLREALDNDTPLNSWNRFTTHELRDYDHDNIMGAQRWLGLNNADYQRVKFIFVPTYLHGNDGIFNRSYYDIIAGLDLSIFPSYYEPWGYTPLESAAFGIPTITTTLAGFGLWAANYSTEPQNGVGVVERTDSNYNQVVDTIADMIVKHTQLPKPKRDAARKKARAISQKALWKQFFVYYEEAYKIALSEKVHLLQ